MSRAFLDVPGDQQPEPPAAPPAILRRMTMLQGIARGPGSAHSKIEALISAACDFDRSAFEMLTRIEADIARCVDEGDWEAVELLAAERRLHRETREILLAEAEKAIRRVDAGVVLRDLLAA